MREIKFRAKLRNLAHEQFPKLHPKTKQDFKYGTGLYNDGTNTWLILESNNECFANLKAKIIDTNTIGQYTGLRDNNSTEIFEGDIVQFYIEVEEDSEEDGIVIGEVKWLSENCRWVTRVSTETEQYYVGLYGDSNFDCIILGNIYDNPELIKE